jgi:hypothetical protein
MYVPGIVDHPRSAVAFHSNPYRSPGDVRPTRAIPFVNAVAARHASGANQPYRTVATGSNVLPEAGHDLPVVRTCFAAEDVVSLIHHPNVASGIHR